MYSLQAIRDNSRLQRLKELPDAELSPLAERNDALLRMLSGRDWSRETRQLPDGSQLDAYPFWCRAVALLCEWELTNSEDNLEFALGPYATERIGTWAAVRSSQPLALPLEGELGQILAFWVPLTPPRGIVPLYTAGPSDLEDEDEVSV